MGIRTYLQAILRHWQHHLYFSIEPKPKELLAVQTERIIDSVTSIPIFSDRRPKKTVIGHNIYDLQKSCVVIIFFICECTVSDDIQLIFFVCENIVSGLLLYYKC